MPRSVSTPMSRRLAFVEDAARGLHTMTALCARSGIGRRVGSKWKARYDADGASALGDRPRVAQRCPHRMPDEVAARLLACRQAHPTWGPRKLLAYLAPRHPRVAWPAASTVGDLLKRHGLSRPRRRRSAPGHPGAPQTPMDAPNAVWTAAFKGEFRTGDGVYCSPLPVVDGYSRLLLACRALPSVATAGARPVFGRLFREYGLPDRLRSDNGVPFATSALGRLSALSAWWIKLGITPELIEPSAPQQNGRHDRMHRTRKAEATKPPRANAAAQQRVFDRFRREYHGERPHEALANATPAAHYTASSRPSPRRPLDPEYPGHFPVRSVSRNGGGRWHNAWVNVRHVAGRHRLAEEYVGLEEVDDGVWSVYFGPVLLGRVDERERRIHGAHHRN